MTPGFGIAARPIAVAGAVGVALAMTMAGSAMVAPSVAASSAAPSCTAGTTVQTNKGPVCGITSDGITTYRGIPYAAPPVGRLRWKSPRPHQRWNTTLQATQDSKECPNPGFPPGSPPAADTTEACLNVKVEMPANAKPGERLPVMYETHGGGFLGESRTDNGENLVHRGRVVYVFVDYRLGILGFLAHKSLGAHSGDYGIQDQQAGLRWVRDNIARFGGNPHNVTVFGESAGGSSVCNQVASPTAKGLFQKGISVSGFYNFQNDIVWSTGDCKSTYYTEAQAQKVGAKFATKVGCGQARDVAACLRRVPVAQLVQAGGQYIEPTAGGTIGPIVNGTTVPMSPAKAFATGHVNHVRLITDVGRDEFNGGIYENYPGLHIIVADTPAQYRQLVREQFHRLAPTVQKLYPLRSYSSPFIAYRTIMADSASVCPMLKADKQLSRHIPVYADINDYGDSTRARDSGLPVGALHSLTNHLVHDPISTDPNEAALQNQLLAQWTHFARTGNPTAYGTPRWVRYGHGRQLVMTLRPAGSSTLAQTNVIEAQHHCTFWNQVTHY